MEDGNYTRSLENLEKSIAWKILNFQKKKKKKSQFHNWKMNENEQLIFTRYFIYQDFREMWK